MNFNSTEREIESINQFQQEMWLKISPTANFEQRLQALEQSHRQLIKVLHSQLLKNEKLEACLESVSNAQSSLKVQQKQDIDQIASKLLTKLQSLQTEITKNNLQLQQPQTQWLSTTVFADSCKVDQKSGPTQSVQTNIKIKSIDATQMDQKLGQSDLTSPLSFSPRDLRIDERVQSRNVVPISPTQSALNSHHIQNQTHITVPSTAAQIAIPTTSFDSDKPFNVLIQHDHSQIETKDALLNKGIMHQNEVYADLFMSPRLAETKTKKSRKHIPLRGKVPKLKTYDQRKYSF